jgi:uncharacterized membrane protein
MSATTAVLPTRSRLNSGWGARFMLAGEVLIGLLWILGALNYVRQGGQQAGILLLAAVLLLGPRIAVASLHLFGPSSTLHPCIWMLLLGLFLPEHLTSAGTIIAPHCVPILLAFICFIGETFTRPLAALSVWFNQGRRAALCLAAFVLIYLAGTTALAILKLHDFGYIGQDIGYFMQCLYTGLHGELFASNQYHDLLYTTTVTSDFAGHNQPVLFLLLPVYWLYPHAETLFIVRNLFLAASAFPAYQLARYRLDRFPSLAITVAFLLGPAILFQNFYDYAPLSLAGLPLLFALLFYTRRQFTPFIASLLLCLFIREDLVMALIGMGVVALLGRRERKWVAAPILIGVLWSIVTWGFIFPHFRHGAVSAVESCFSYLGSTPAESLRTIFTHPSAYLTHKAIVYIKQVFTHYGILLPFFSPVSLLAFPYLMINVLGDPGCNAAIVFRHYSLIPSILLLPGVSIAIRRVASRPKLGWRLDAAALALVLVSVGTTVLSLGQAELNWWHRDAWQAEALRIPSQIPAAAAVAVPRYMLPFTADRNSVYQTLRLLDYYHPNAEYIVVDRNPDRMGVTPTWKAHYDDLLSRLKDPTEFAVIYASDNFEIYHLIGKPLVSLRLFPGGVAND